MKLLDNIAGEICRIVLPINEEIFFGNSKSILALCTLSSMRLLKEISYSDLMTKISIAGRLLSENKGIDSLVRHVISNKNIKTIVICGKDAAGHRPGHSLFNLYGNGLDYDGRIIGSSSPDPVLTLTHKEVLKFQNQVKLINAIGEINISKIKSLIDSIISV
jgi:tetrahydromethanopterin S-methyltransferase subunit A